MGSIMHRHEVEILHRPQGPSLRSRLCCPGPSSLTRPHAPHSQAHRNFTAQRLICGAFAVRERLGDPRAVPGFRCPFRPDMPSSTTPGSSHIRVLTGSALPRLPQIRFARAVDFVASVVRTLLRPASLFAPLNGSDRIAPAIGDFYIWASGRSVALPTSRDNYNSDWTPLLAGLSPAGMAASLAAPDQ